MTKPAYQICVFNLCTDEPIPDERSEDAAHRKATYHYVGFSSDEVSGSVDRCLKTSCDWNWSVPIYIGGFPTKLTDKGHEVFDVETLKCLQCGLEF